MTAAQPQPSQLEQLEQHLTPDAENNTMTDPIDVQFTQQPAPDGYWVDAKGVLTPAHLIKPIDKMRDVLVKELIEGAHALNKALQAYKLKSFTDIQAFIDLSGEHYGANIGGKKGNVSLTSYDGRYKIQRALQDKIAFDERMQAAKELIDACISEWKAGARSELHVIVSAAFNTDKEGEINTGRVLALRRYDIDDPRWLKAMDAISDSIKIVGSKTYIRLYQRHQDSQPYQQIPLDMSSV